MSLILNRRTAIGAAAVLAAASFEPRSSRAAADVLARLPRTAAKQIALPFAEGALDPAISAKTIAVHYGKHHKAYADKVAEAIRGTSLEDSPLEDIIIGSSGDPAALTLANMAGQLWNHNFYWRSLTPSSRSPSGKLLATIERDLGSLDACVAALAKVSVAQFGSGWGWLVVEDGSIKAVSTGNADLPFLHNQIALLAIDVWEHAYYLDYQNRRADHVAAVLSRTVNWEFAEENFEASR